MATSVNKKQPPKRKLPALIMIGIEHKPTGSPDEPPVSKGNTPYDTPTDDNAGKGPGGTTIKPGEANFHDQTHTCSTCEYFSPEGNNGVGECKMGVPEADFTKSDPDASWCRFWEANDDATETPEQEAAEQEQK